jgi:hypothetical protein
MFCLFGKTRRRRNKVGSVAGTFVLRACVTYRILCTGNLGLLNDAGTARENGRGDSEIHVPSLLQSNHMINAASHRHAHC